MKFKDRVIIVTGGAQGIGRAISRAFAQEGARVVIADLDYEAGIENRDHILGLGQEALFVHTDTSKEDDVKNMVKKTILELGEIHILINNAGISAFGSMQSNSMDLWDKVMSVNLRGTYMCCKYCSEYMISAGNGSIINIASTRAFMSEPDTEAYSASKGGIIALTHSLAVSLGKHGIRVNAISPGWIDVTHWQKAATAAPSALRDIDHSQHPAGRVGVPMDIANACLFLGSQEASFITGTNLTVDGGMTIKMIYEE